VFGKKIIREIFGPNRNEINDENGILSDTELVDL